MNCTSCGGALAIAPSGSVARCSSCQQYFGIMNGAPLAIAVSEPWPARTRDQEEGAERDRAMTAAEHAPNAGSSLRFILPVIIMVVMGGVGLSIYLSTQQSSAPMPPPPAAAPPSPPKPPVAVPKKK